MDDRHFPAARHAHRSIGTSCLGPHSGLVACALSLLRNRAVLFMDYRAPAPEESAVSV